MTVDDSSIAPNTHYPAIFLSDIHLGTKGCQADRLIDFLTKHSCDKLYLVGDVVDGWQLKSNFHWPEEHGDVLRHFLAMTARRTRIYYIVGNHDEMLRRFTGLELGNVSLLEEVEHRCHNGERLLVIHGDQFDQVTSNHRTLAVLGAVGYNILQRTNGIVNFARGLFGYPPWSLSAWAKSRVKQAVGARGNYEQRVSEYCRAKGYDGIVCGHIHRADISEMGGVRYMNCGDWVESCTALVEDSRGEFRILNWSRPAVVEPGKVDAREVAG